MARSVSGIKAQRCGAAGISVLLLPCPLCRWFPFVRPRDDHLEKSSRRALDPNLAAVQIDVYLGVRVALVRDVEAEGVRFAFVFVILQLLLVLVESTLWFFADTAQPVQVLLACAARLNSVTVLAPSGTSSCGLSHRPTASCRSRVPAGAWERCWSGGSSPSAHLLEHVLCELLEA